MTTRLSRHDFDACSRSLRELYAETSLEAFPKRLLSLMIQLVPSSYVSWNAFNEQQQIFFINYSPERPDLKPLLPQFSATVHTSPLFDHFQSAATFPKLISDVMTQRQFQQTACYREYYRHAGMKHQIIFSLPRDKTHVSLALNRLHRNFSERDRAVVSFLSPHMAQAYKNARIASKLTGDLETVGNGLDSLRRAVVLAGTDGGIRWQSELARDWLREFFPGATPIEQLPPVLIHWLKRAGKSVAPNRPVFSEFQLAGSNRCRLLIYSGKIAGGYMVVLMRERMEIEPTAAQALGLTLREAEILFWLSEAKTRPEIAAILNISWRTIGKHMEHIFTKLGVANRLEAQRIGLELRRM